MNKKHYNKIHTHIYYTFLSIIFNFKLFFNKNVTLNHTYEKYFYKYNLLLKYVYLTINNSKIYKSFYRCINLKYAYILNSKIIPALTFCNCYNLTYVFIDKHTLEIHNGAFQNCKKLKKIYIPKTIKTIQNDAFLNCINLQKIIFY